MSLALLQNKNLSVLAYVEAFWWSEATQIRTIALWGIFGGDFIESDRSEEHTSELQSH